MMQQYHEVKRGLPRDTLLLFRLGDFFELFFDDAILASKLLGLTLTKRLDHAMCGLPSQALDTYVGKLLAFGKKVAICDQSEPAVPGKLVKRSLTRILSPGTTLAANQLDAQRNHYLAAFTSIAAACTSPGSISRRENSGWPPTLAWKTCFRSSRPWRRRS
jgi:DNA mismatch repair protein MutS